MMNGTHTSSAERSSGSSSPLLLPPSAASCASSSACSAASQHVKESLNASVQTSTPGGQSQHGSGLWYWPKHYRNHHFCACCAADSPVTKRCRASGPEASSSLLTVA
jgi:hypothetical protein